MTHQLNPTTVDGILEYDNQVLLIRRAHAPFDGRLALPGGFVDYGERVEEAVVRELYEEVSISAKPKTILGVYSGTERDPRGPTISVVFICSFEGNPKAADDAAAFQWVSLDKLGDLELAFDHNQIMQHYISWKHSQQTFWSGK